MFDNVLIPTFYIEPKPAITKHSFELRSQIDEKRDAINVGFFKYWKVARYMLVFLSNIA